MRRLLYLVTVIVTLTSLSTTFASYYEQVNQEKIELITSPLFIPSGSSVNFPLQERYFISDISLYAISFRRDVAFEIIVNGEVKKTVRLPILDRNKPISIRDVSEEIEIRSLSGDFVLYFLIATVNPL